MRIADAVTITIALAGLAACSRSYPPTARGGGGGPAGSVTIGPGIRFVSSHNGSMNPAVDTVMVGDPVTWTWSGALPHNVRSVGAPSFPSSPTRTGAGTHAVTFTAPGVYQYDCVVHGAAMTGRIVVLGPIEQGVRLRDVVISNLPSPYYHFEYDTAGRVSFASFASELRMYEVAYDGGRISEMRSLGAGSSERLEYSYDNVGRVGAVRYVDATGRVYTIVHFTYAGPRLVGLERERTESAGVIVDKTMAFSYYADGNLLEITEHRPPIDGQQESTLIDHFEQYDDGINVDGFGLIHDEFFDHLILLPGVRLQQGNPGRVTHTGDGLNYRVDYAYAYDDGNRPLTKRGEATLLNGPDAGRTFQLHTAFSYY